MLNLVKMPKPQTCSVCCIAMLTHTTFDEALKLCFKSSPSNFCMTFNEMENTLNKAGFKTTHLNTFPRTITHNLSIECRNKKENYWHYIVYDATQQTFLDPIPYPPPINDYAFYQIVAIDNEE